MTKTSQLQIRVSPAEKAAIAQSAERAGVSISKWVLDRALPQGRRRFQSLVAELGTLQLPSAHALASLNDLLTDLSPAELVDAVAEPPSADLSELSRAYLAAMVELAAHRARKSRPSWCRNVGPVSKPYFASELKSLRMHLLRHSPPPFRRRNIFIDASLGDRV